MMKNKWKLFTTAAVLVASLAIFAGCGSDSDEKTQAEVLKVGTNATYVPFEFKNENNEYTGFDMEFAEALAKKLGKEAEIHNISFDGLIPAIMTNEIDVVMAAMVITPERQEKVDYVPYFKAGLGILVDKDLTEVKGKEDLIGKKVAAQMGTTGAYEAQTIPDVQLREFDHNSEALLELRKGGVDAVVCSIPVAKHYIATEKDANVRLVEQPLHQQTLGIAVQKGNTELLEKVKKALLELKEDGTYDTLYKKWFGTESPEEWR